MSAAVWHGRASLAGLATPRALYHDWLGEGMRVLWLEVEGMHAADLWKDLSQGEARVGGRRGRDGPCGAECAGVVGGEVQGGGRD